MSQHSRTKQQLLQENEELIVRLTECEDTLEAIRTGAVDALVVSDAQGERIFTLQSIDYSYRVMAETMNEGTVTLDNNGTIVFANKAFSALTGCEMSTLVGARLNELLTGSLSEFSSFIEECTLRPGRGEFSIACKQGGSLPVSISGTTFTVSGKQNVCLIISDLRERKEAEAKLRNAYEEVEKKVLDRTEELRESEARFRSLYETMNEGLANHDIVFADGKAVDYVITAVNPAFEKITGLARQLAVGSKATGLYRTADPPYLDIYGRVALIGVPEHFETYFPPLEKYFAISVFSPGKGKFATIFTDITQRKQAEEELRAANEELTEFNRIMVGRELRMIELKKEINDLCAKDGTPPRYEIESEEGRP